MSDDGIIKMQASTIMRLRAQLAELEAENARLSDIVLQLEAVNEGWRNDATRLRGMWEQLREKVAEQKESNGRANIHAAFEMERMMRRFEAERPEGDAVSISPERVDETAKRKHEQLTGEMAVAYRYTEGFITDGICACSFPPAARTADSNQICGCCGRRRIRSMGERPEGEK